MYEPYIVEISKGKTGNTKLGIYFIFFFYNGRKINCEEIVMAVRYQAAVVYK